MSALNTYYTWNAEHPDLTYENSNDVLFNVVSCKKAFEIQKSYPGYSSFTLKSSKHVTHSFDVDDAPDMFFKKSTYLLNDVSEVLRGDYSRLFFDVDCKSFATDETDILTGLEQIAKMVNILTHSQLKYFGGYVETCLNIPNTTKPTKKIKQLLDKFNISKNMVIIYNPYTKKEFSAHFYLTKYYFKRDDLYELFSDFNSKIKKFNSRMAECIDCTVYVRRQRIFRFPLSGKCLEGRKPTPYMPKEIDLNFMVCGKTSEDDTFISENSPEFNEVKLYLKSLILPSKTLKNKKQEEDLFNFEISEEQKKILRKYDFQCQWFYRLIKLMKLKIFENPKITEKELYDEFIQPKYQYITQTHKNIVINAAATKTAVKKAFEKELSFSDISDELFVDLKYTFTELQHKLLSVANRGINILQLAELIHNSFVFFSKIDTDNPQALDLAYLNDSNEINIQTIENFDKIQRANPITFKVLFKKDSELIEVKMNLSKAIRFVQFRNIKREYTLYTQDVHKLSLYSPVYPEIVNNTLNEYHNEILNLMATERSIDYENDKFKFVYNVNQEKKQFLINFFAYIVQHPENRNRICLQLSSVPGLGKNMFTNSICQFLGKFAWGNSNVDNVIGNYNGGVDTKLLIVMNEADTKDKNTDKMKSAITEDEIPINIKFGRAYTGINHASYVIFTNHLDTKTIASNDRRFAFIRSNGVPKSKEWYAQMIDKETGKIKQELVDNLIGYLLNVDLSEYNASLAPMFDKKLIYDARFEKRSIYYKIAYYILHLNNPVILKSDFIDIVNQVKNNIMTFQDFEQTKDIEELEDLTEELQNTKGEALTNRTLANLIQFNDEDDMEMKKWKKKGANRDKHVLCLK